MNDIYVIQIKWIFINEEKQSNRIQFSGFFLCRNIRDSTGYGVCLHKLIEYYLKCYIIITCMWMLTRTCGDQDIKLSFSGLVLYFSIRITCLTHMLFQVSFCEQWLIYWLTAQYIDGSLAPSKQYFSYICDLNSFRQNEYGKCEGSKMQTNVNVAWKW